MRQKYHAALSVFYIAVNVLVNAAKKLIWTIDGIKKAIHYLTLFANVTGIEKVIVFSAKKIAALSHRNTGNVRIAHKIKKRSEYLIKILWRYGAQLIASRDSDPKRVVIVV